MKITIDEIIKACGAVAAQKGELAQITGVSIDTRALKAGDLFIAIKGAHFDGHDFIDEAVKKGACGIVRSQKSDVGRRTSDIRHQASDFWILEVNDTVQALGDVASCWRAKVKCTVIAVTGSNGKSTTKEMIAGALSATRKTIKTEGNFNNLIGLPLQVMRIEPETEIAVLEMGMNAKGEIKSLTEICKPSIGLITNVNPAHLEKLHTVENVALAKGELFEAMASNGTIVINAEDPWAVNLGKKYKGNKISFGMQNSCDVRFGRMVSEGLDKTDLTFYAEGREYSIVLPAPGVHNVMNALAAIATGIAAGATADSMIPGLEKFAKMKMRMERVQLINGVQLVNDSYNANPSSMYAALRTVSGAKRAGRFIAVFGDMLELGESSSEKHSELGRNAASFGVAKLFLTGKYAKDVADGAGKNGLSHANIVVAADIEELKQSIISEIKTGDIVLVKGSRGMRMEQIVEYLKDNVGV
jgi:UDP-N-acetylmuramoyl-tripeptide--D-alanyl-D-alanine ligase